MSNQKRTCYMSEPPKKREKSHEAGYWLHTLSLDMPKYYGFHIQGASLNQTSSHI